VDRRPKRLFFHVRQRHAAAPALLV
jgi:hypothetical protein